MSKGHPNNLDRLRQAFSSEGWNEASKDCPGHEMLWASAAEDLDPVADENILLHLAQCTLCSSIWQLAREMIPREETTAASVVGILNFRRLKTSARRTVLAIAATVLVGVGLGAGLFLNRGPSSPPVYREQQNEGGISALAATAEMSRTACRFRWTPGPEGTLYDLVVTNENLDVLLSVKDLGDAEYLLPPERLPRETREVFWRVSAHGPDGGTTASETFTTRIEIPKPVHD